MKRTNRALAAALPLTACLLFSAGAAQAASYLTSDENCTAANVTLTSIATSAGGNSVFDGSLVASSCFGVVGGNDSGAHGLPAGQNIGQSNDGLLNGGGKNGATGEGIDPLTFIQSGQYLDLDGDGEATDPGWIYLGKYENNGFTGWNKPLDISSVLDFSLTFVTDTKGKQDKTQGTWTLTTFEDIIDTVIEEGVLTDRSLFDHLALILKAGDNYVVYDFDFNQLQEELGDDFDYQTPYVLSGTWNTGDLTNKNGKAKDLSHLSVWARDPIGPMGDDEPSNSIPAAGTLLLLGLGLTMLLGARIRMHG